MPRTDDELRALAEKIQSYATSFDAARAMGVAASSLRGILSAARSRGLLGPLMRRDDAELLAAPAPSHVEIRNEKFWKARAAALANDLAETRHILEQVSGLMEPAPTPPTWALPKPNKPGRAAGLLHISDIQAGEVVLAEEINRLNAFDVSICRKRLRRMFAASIQMLPRWAADCRLEGIVNAVNGDLVSGDIHEELRETNEIVSLEQVELVTDELCAGFAHQADAFGKVDAYFTPGNHGRQTQKTHVKRTSALNYDILIGKQVKRHFDNDPRVTIHVSAGRDCEYSILGHRVLQTHHDQGGGGGQGFAGPVLPILRKAKKIEHLSAQTRDFYDIILTAHHHISTHPTRKHFGNGSVPGYNEFARSILADPEPPMQWLLLVTEKWGVRERGAIVLDKLGGWE